MSEETKEVLGVGAGDVVAGRYRLVKLLGRGGMGSVWLCDHLSLLSHVALKVIKPAIAGSPNLLARFMREAKAAAMLRSPHVVQILDHGTDGKVAFIAMELLEGESLHSRLARAGPLGARLTATVMTHVGRAMAKAHETGIVHRDLKPDNIFLVRNDDEIVTKVLDFGIAKSAMVLLNQTDSPQTQTGALLGTPYYMSPEQATGQKTIDQRTDLWAMGVITYECLLGRRPYQSEALGELVLQICSYRQPIPSEHGAVPTGFDQWFAKANARDPALRFQSAKELTSTLREVLSDPVARGSGAVTLAAGRSPSASISRSGEGSPPGIVVGAAEAPSPGRTDAADEDAAAEQRRSASVGSGTVPLTTLEPLSTTRAPRRGRAVIVAAAAIAALGLAAATVAKITAGTARTQADPDLASSGSVAASGAPRATATLGSASSTVAAGSDAAPGPDGAPTGSALGASSAGRPRLPPFPASSARAAVRPSASPAAVGPPPPHGAGSASAKPTSKPDDPLGI